MKLKLTIEDVKGKRGYYRVRDNGKTIGFLRFEEYLTTRGMKNRFHYYSHGMTRLGEARTQNMAAKALHSAVVTEVAA
jgi:hypothetical protein